MQIFKMLFLGVPLALGGFTSTVHPTPLAPCAVASEWAAAHESTLPTSLAGLSAYNLTYRKAIYGSLPDSIKTRLWHEQLAYYAAQAMLNDAQHKFVTDADRDLEKNMSMTADGVARRKDFAAQGRQLFGDSLFTAVFATLGVNVVPEKIAITNLKLGISEELPVSCVCNVAHDQDWGYCGDGVACVNNGCKSLVGCGPFWCSACDGTCNV